MIRRALCTLITLLLSPALDAQSRVSNQGAHRMEVTLERLEQGAWKIIEPGLVLAKNDRVRFRFKSNFTGYLYVTNQSTSSTNALLFPRQDTGANNRILANREYTIPATSGAFRVDGPEGFDVVSWLVSPVELGRPAVPAPTPVPEGRLMPRCDDTIFRARGACVDTSAGPQAVKDEKSDDLLVIRDKESSVIATTVPLKRPIVYEFHLAHR